MNLIQQALYEYIIDKDYNDKMLQYNALLDYLFEDLLVEAATDDTAAQELLTCFFFDAYFNKHQKDIIEISIKGRSKTPLKLYDYYIENLPKNLKKYSEVFNKIMGKNDYKLSFIYQIKTYKKWLDKHSNFNNSAFIHHDTGLGFYNGKLIKEKDWGNLPTRVEKGKTLFRISDKDIYQKADIYAITEEGKESLSKSEININDEVEFWKTGIEKGQFVGISLKKLGDTESKVYTWGYDNINLDIAAIDNKNNIMKFEPNVNLFNIKDISNISNNKDLGTITMNLLFGLNIKDTNNNEEENKDVYISIKSNGNSDDHAIYSPSDSFKAANTVELKYKSGKAQIGKVKTKVSEWEELLPKPDVEPEHNSNNFNEKIKNINNLFGNIEGFVSELPESAKENINIICDSRNDIDALYTKIESYTGKTTTERKQYYKDNKGQANYYDNDKIAAELKELLNKLSDKFNFLKNIIDKNTFDYNIRILYNITKWYSTCWNLLTSLDIIGHHLEDDENMCVQLFKAAKFSTLPYVSIG